MESDIDDSKFIIAIVKPEPTELTTPVSIANLPNCAAYFRVEVDHRNVPTLKEEKCTTSSTLTTDLQTISNPEIPQNGIKIKLELDDFFDPPSSDKNPGDQDIASESRRLAEMYQIKENTRRVLYTTKVNDTHKSYCEICMKGFSRKDSLPRHLKIHYNNRKYPCNFCSRCFLRKDHLSMHMKVHTGEKNYKCATCMKCCARKDELARHMKSHTKNYKCDLQQTLRIERTDDQSHEEARGRRLQKCSRGVQSIVKIEKELCII